MKGDNIKDMGTIYVFTSPSGKRYVGQTVMPLRERIVKHASDSRTGRGTVFHNSIKKYGIENFSLVTAECIPDECLNEWEAEIIKRLGTLHPHGYNLEPGGGQNGHPCEETRRKLREKRALRISSWNKGIPQTEEQKRINSLKNMGRKASQATKEACRETGKKRKGSIPWNKGKTFSEESKRKMSVSQRRYQERRRSLG